MHLSVMAKILDYNTLVFMCSFVTGSSLMLFVCYRRTHTHTCIPLRICTQKRIFLSIPIFCTIKRMCSTDKQNLWFAQCSLRNRLLFKGKFFKWCIKMHLWCISLPFTETNIKNLIKYRWSWWISCELSNPNFPAMCCHDKIKINNTGNQQM